MNRTSGVSAPSSPPRVRGVYKKKKLANHSPSASASAVPTPPRSLRSSDDAQIETFLPPGLVVSPTLCLHHVHGILREEGVDVGKGWAELAVSVPATQHELVETLRTHGWFAQVHLQESMDEGLFDE